MGNTLVDYRTEAGVATIELCDPPMNSFTYEMMKDLDDAILDARFDNDVHALVITGYGDRFFSAGANVQMLSEVDPAFRFYFGLYAAETLDAAREYAQARDRSVERAHRRGWARDRLGLRSAHRP